MVRLEAAAGIPATAMATRGHPHAGQDDGDSQKLLGSVLNVDEPRRPARHILGVPVSVFAGGAYCTASMSMVRLGLPPPLAAAAACEPAFCHLPAVGGTCIQRSRTAAAAALAAASQQAGRRCNRLQPPGAPPAAPQVLLNKIALSSFAFKSANALLFFQCALCVVLVQLCKLGGLVKVRSRGRGAAHGAAPAAAAVGAAALRGQHPPSSMHVPPCHAAHPNPPPSAARWSPSAWGWCVCGCPSTPSLWA